MKNPVLKQDVKKRGRPQLRLRRKELIRSRIRKALKVSNSDHLCDVCGKAYTTQTGLSQHRETHSRLFHCSHCNTTVKSKQYRKQHQVNALLCRKCQLSFACKGPLRVHMKTHRNGAIGYHCAKFSPSGKVKVHQKTHKGRQHLCGQCKEVFLERKALRAHQRARHKISVLCEFCGKSFLTGRGLQRHRKTHTGEDNQKQPYRCTKCDKAFRTRNSLRLHDINHHGAKSLFSCDLCGRQFLNNSRLLEHIRISHTGEKIFSCHRCGKGFTCSRNLKRHLLEPSCMSQGERYKCKECSKMCKSKHSLMYHVTTHHGNKPFRCKFCDRGYATKENWQKHEAAHNGIYGVMPKKKVIKEVSLDFLCEECGKTYGNKHLLARHLLLHTGEKPHVCITCSKSFRCKSTLTEHERIHSGEKPFHCDHCGITFRLSGHLRYHLKALHKVKEVGRLKKIKPRKPVQNIDKDLTDGEKTKEIKVAGEVLKNHSGSHDKETVASDKGTISEMEPDEIMDSSPVEQPAPKNNIGSAKMEHLPPLIPSSDINLTDSRHAEDLLNLLMQGSWLQCNDQHEERPKEDIFQNQFGQHQLYQTQCTSAQGISYDGHSGTEKMYMYPEQLSIFGSLQPQSFTGQSLQQMLYDPQQGKICSYTYDSHQKKQFEADAIEQETYELHHGQSDTFLAAQRMSEVSYVPEIPCPELPSASFMNKDTDQYQPQYKELETRIIQPNEPLWYKASDVMSSLPSQNGNDEHRNNVPRSATTLSQDDSDDKAITFDPSDKDTRCEVELKDHPQSSSCSTEQSLVIVTSNITIEKEVQHPPISKVLVESCDMLSDAIDAIINKESKEYETLKPSSLNRLLPNTDDNIRKFALDSVKDSSRIHLNEKTNTGKLTKPLQDVHMLDNDEKRFDRDLLAPKEITALTAGNCSNNILCFCGKKCDSTFKSQDNLDVHAASHHQTKNYNELREKNVEQKETLNDDKKNMRDFLNQTKSKELVVKVEPSHLCEVCGKSYQTKSSLRHHKKTHSTKAYTCIQCQQTFNSWNSMRMHNINHHKGKPPQQCTLCGKGFLHVAKLEEHIRIQHTGETPFNCQKCSKSFTCRRNLKRHLNEPTCTPVERFPCDQCQKTCKSQYSLTYHKSVHHTHKPYHCELCGKGYAVKENCTRHENNHGELPKSAKQPKTTSKDFVCVLCDKAYSNKHFLARHKQTHTGIKPFQCSMCSKAFLYKSALKEHLRTHSGEKPYICQHCGISFRLSGHLRYHLKAVHNGDKPYSCSVCRKGFIFQSTMVHHLKTHTDQNDKLKKTNVKGNHPGDKNQTNKNKEKIRCEELSNATHEMCKQNEKTNAIPETECTSANLAQKLQMGPNDVSAIRTGILQRRPTSSAINNITSEDELTTGTQDYQKNVSQEKGHINNTAYTSEANKTPTKQTDNVENHNSTTMKTVAMLTPPLGLPLPAHTQSSLLAVLAAHAGSQLPHPNCRPHHPDYVPFIQAHAENSQPTECTSYLSSVNGMSNDPQTPETGVLPMHPQRLTRPLLLPGNMSLFSGFTPIIPQTTK